MTPRPAIGVVRVSTEMQATQYGPDRQREDITLEAARTMNAPKWHALKELM